MLFPADLATADLGALEAAAPAVHREEYRKTVAAGNRATVTRTDSLGRATATTYDSWLRPTATTALGETSARTLSPAGRVRAAYNPDGSVATVTNRLGETTSYRYDSRTGLYNYGYRDYNPQTVRFTTVDPILKLPTTLGLKERS